MSQRSIEIPDRAATMRKVVLVLALIACDCSRDVLVHGDPIRKPEAAGRSDDYEYQVIARELYVSMLSNKSSLSHS